MLAHTSTGSGAARGEERNASMGFVQYHEPANELPQEVRTFARMIASLTEEAEAIGWYEQRLAVEQNSEARAVMANSQEEEFKHFGMDLEFLLRQKPKWRIALQDILFKECDIVEHGKELNHTVKGGRASPLSAKYRLPLLALTKTTVRRYAIRLASFTPKKTHFLCGKGPSQLFCACHRGLLTEEGGDTKEG